MINLCDDGAVNLVCAIVTRAAAEYTAAVNTLDRLRRKEAKAKTDEEREKLLEKRAMARKKLNDCVEFFEGKWFADMLDLLPDEVLNITPEEFKARLDEDIELVKTGMLPPKRAYNNTTREIKQR